MTIKALIFGSVGALVETTELDRLAHNEAFLRYGLDWSWDRMTHLGLQTLPTELARIDEFGMRMGEPLSAHQLYDVHAKMIEIRSDAICRAGSDRPGVAGLVESAKQAGVRLAWATTTDRVTVAAVSQAAGVSLDVFDVVVDGDSLDRPNSYAVYQRALTELELDPDEVVAVEDSLQTRDAPAILNIPVVVFPGVYHRSTIAASSVPTVAGDRLPTIDGLAMLLGNSWAQTAA